MSDEEKKVNRVLSLAENIVKMEQNLAEAKAELAKLNHDVSTLAQMAADRYLVDDNGQPVDGAIYWYHYQALVRLGTMVRIIPCKTMDGETLFAPPSIELPAEELAEVEA